ncbi:50S ribosomal protein L10 [bacterium]|nr:50S ribosomal protein L10 [bacterium]
MPQITRAQKEAIVEELTELWKNSSGVLFTTYIGIDANSMSQLRRTIRDWGGVMKVAKHTLIKICVNKLYGDQFNLDALFQNSPTALIFLPSDFPAFLKNFNRLLRDYQMVKIKGGIIEGRQLDGEACVALANLPPREVLLAQVTAAIASPITSLVYTLQSIIARLIWSLEAIRKSKGGE